LKLLNSKGTSSAAMRSQGVLFHNYEIFFYCLLFILVYTAPLSARADTTVLKVICVGEDSGAEVSINGVPHGRCPLDIQVSPGLLKLRAVKTVDAAYERVVEQDIRIYQEKINSVELRLRLQLTAIGQREEATRLQQGRPRAGIPKQDHSAAEAVLHIQQKLMPKIQATLQEFKKDGLEPGNGKSFMDCPTCPEMVLIPAGSFMMGEPGKQQLTTIHMPFAVSKFEVTFAEWDACIAAEDCGGHRLSDHRWGRGDRPAINVRWNDAKQYVRWLSQNTGKTYRLLTEAEWEYAARAGTTTAYYWGEEIGTGNANCFSCGSRWDNQQTAPVGSFPANPFGLHDMYGNAWEWVDDCDRGNCAFRIMRGGSWFTSPYYARQARRVRIAPGDYFFSGNYGFRVARALP
jgi:formylglycine-generating enzyme required for sulfatase activity